MESDSLSPWILAVSEVKHHGASKWQIGATHMANSWEADEEKEEPGPGLPMTYFLTPLPPIRPYTTITQPLLD